MACRLPACANDTWMCSIRSGIDCLNGDKYKTGKLTPEGAPDPSVFSTEFNHEGIQVGTAMPCSSATMKHASLRCRSVSPLLGQEETSGIACKSRQGRDYAACDAGPRKMGLAFMPGQVAAAYRHMATVAGVVPGLVPRCARRAATISLWPSTALDWKSAWRTTSTETSP